MVHRRGVLPVLLLLALVLIGAGIQIASGSSGGPAGGRTAQPAATPSPAAGGGAAAVRSLAAVEHAFNAGDVPLLCRPGVLIDPPVLDQQAAAGPGCAAELEALMANAPPLRLTVRSLSARPGLASVTVRTARGDDVVVDVVRRGGRWLLSFSDGSDPMPALAGTE